MSQALDHSSGGRQEMARKRAELHDKAGAEPIFGLTQANVELKAERDTLRGLLREVLEAQSGGYFRGIWFGGLVERITAALKEGQ